MDLIDILIVSPFIVIAITWFYMLITGSLECNLAGLDKFMSLAKNERGEDDA